MVNVIFILIGIILLLAGNSFVIGHDLFRKIWWLDVVFHAYGGLLMTALFIFAVRSKKIFNVWTLVVCSFVIGVMWEALEFFISTPFFGTGSARIDDPIWLLDTIKDLGVDVLSSVLFWKLYTAYNKNHD